MESHFIHTVDVNHLNRKYRRNAVSPSIKIFALEDLVEYSRDLMTSLIESNALLKYDLYDVGFKIEKAIQKFDSNLYNAYCIEWLQMWETIGSNVQDKSRMIQFWLKRGDLSEMILEELERLEPHRKRSCYQFKVARKSQNIWNIKENGAPIFKQNVSDTRSRSRRFPASDIEIIRHPDLIKLIGAIAQTISYNPNTQFIELKITMHQMLTLAKGARNNEPAPEGVHQDGADFIVSAIVIERVNVKGGISKIYYGRPNNQADNSKLAIQHQLEVGEGIFQSDEFNDYWHGITPIFRVQKDVIGYRAILGFDIEIVN